MNTLFYCSIFFVIDLNNKKSHLGTFVWYYPHCCHIMRPIYLYLTETVTNLMLITSVVDFEQFKFTNSFVTFSLIATRKMFQSCLSMSIVLVFPM